MRARGLARLALPIAVVALLAVALPGCTRMIRNTAFEEQGIKVLLVSYKRFTSTVEPGYQHPLTIAPVRVAHILSRIDLRLDVKEGMERVPAIDTEQLYTIAEGVSQSLAKANPNQQVAVQAVLRTKRFGLFDRKHLTSFVAYGKDGLLYLHMSRYNWEIPREKRERIPIPELGEHPQSFKILASRGMAIVDDQSVAVAWDDPIFKNPTRTRITATGKVVRKTILMESPEEETEAAPIALPDNLSPETLRRLANLEEERRNGSVTESEYDLRRRAILRADPSTR